MEHNLFKPKSFEEGKHAVVGDCNGFSMQERWEKETPEFAKAILKYAPQNATILDYGCGVGRLAKEILKQRGDVRVIGVDASSDMLEQAKQYVDNDRFFVYLPHHLAEKVDVAYCVYVLQHVPSIEIRDILSRIHTFLRDSGTFVYCSSDYRMAIRFDGQGFFDDRFLGIDLRAEVSRLFDIQSELFDEEVLKNNPVVKIMVKDGLQHPANVYKKKVIDGPLFNARAEERNEPIPSPAIATSKKKKLLLLNRLAPGDILVMTNAIRDLTYAYPTDYEIDVRTPVNEIFDNNPYITKLSYNENDYEAINRHYCSRSGALNDADSMKPDNELREIFTRTLDDITVIDMHYPYIHSSGLCGWHFGYGHTKWLEKILGITIPITDIRPQIYLNNAEKEWSSPVVVKKGLDKAYWVINAGSKGDYTLKQYPYYQEVVDMLQGKITFVQVGQVSHNHVPLKGVINMLGETNMRQLFRVIKHCEGVLTCVSLPMHVAASFNKPCVVVAGAREGTRWELYPNHQFLYVNGCLPCATYDGCWKGKFEECRNKKNGNPLCMELISPLDIVRSIERYYEGGMLAYDFEHSFA